MEVILAYESAGMSSNRCAAGLDCEGTLPLTFGQTLKRSQRLASIPLLDTDVNVAVLKSLLLLDLFWLGDSGARAAIVPGVGEGVVARKILDIHKSERTWLQL